MEYIQHIDELANTLNVKSIKEKLVNSIPKDISKSDFYTYAAETAASLIAVCPDYDVLASKIVISRLHEITYDKIEDVAEIMYNYVNPETEEHSPLISRETYNIMISHGTTFNKIMKYEKDYKYNYFGIKTLMRSYLFKVGDTIVERPQQMLLRVAIGLHKEDITSVIKTYEVLSDGMYTHATPTLFNSGTDRPQLSSCFLVNIKGDSIHGIYDTLKDCAVISKFSGGIGISVQDIRAKGSYIKGTNGHSDGIVPLLRCFNNTARYVDQGGGKRKGAFAIYLEPWHGDILEFLDLRKNQGLEENRARDLFYSLWVPDLFMKRVQKDEMWSLFCPNTAKGLTSVYGEEFENLYESYEKKGKYIRQIPARKLYNQIIISQQETGTPYMMYKDSCNNKSNHKNLGTIKSSNLCAEIVQYTAPDEIAVCNLASIALPKYVENGVFNFNKLYEVARIVTRNLDKVIDVNWYPVKEAEYSNKKHRPIGIGVQGLADVFAIMKLTFDGAEAKKLNVEIFETIYFAALTESCELAKENKPYDSYQGSPVSENILQFDMWNVKPSDRWNWTELREKIAKYGVRNSLLTAPMPTASTSQILGNNECFEPFTSNLYVRRTLAGEFIVVNKHLVRDLIELNLWNVDLKDRIVAEKGSIQNIKRIPEEIRLRYRTSYEISGKSILDMAADRGAFIDQSQSLNSHMRNATVEKVSSMHMYAWKKGLKTGMYYLRTKAAVDAIQFTLDQNKIKEDKENEMCTMKEGCISCSG